MAKFFRFPHAFAKTIALKRLSSRKWSLRTLLWVLIPSIIFFGYVAVGHRHKVFTLELLTETVSIDVVNTVSEWNLEGADLYTDRFSENPSLENLGEFSSLYIDSCQDLTNLTGCVNVTVQRQGVGPMRIRLLSDMESVGHVSLSDGSIIPLGSWATVVIPITSSPKVLPFRGTIIAGDDVASEVDSILLGGKLSVVEEKLFSLGHYTSGEEQIAPGDRVTLLTREEEKPTLDGFLRAEPAEFSEAANAMLLIAYGNADHARVDRYGSAGFKFKTYLWARFVNDPVTSGFFAVLALVALLLEVFSKARELSPDAKEAKKNKSKKKKEKS